MLPIDLFEFITKNKQKSGSEYLLSYKGKTNSLNKLLAEQLNIYPKAQHKIPQFVDHHCWFTSKSYKQSSSQASAIFKSSLVKGETFIDLSGGLGVDDWAFSKVFMSGISLDPDEELNEIVRINFDKLAVKNIQRLDSSAEDFLKTNARNFDFIYLDADRRSETKRSLLLGDGSPNYLDLAPILWQIGKLILLKLSPLVDLNYLKENLTFLKDLFVVSVDQEVKEILALIEPNYEHSVKIHAVEIDAKNDIRIFSAIPIQNIDIQYTENKQYLFEPAPSIIKSGLSMAYAQSLNLHQLAQNTAFYVGQEPIPNFTGRQFKLTAEFEFGKSKLKRFLKDKGIEKANITKRNFNLSVEEIRKAFAIKEGGQDYLFFGTLSNGKRMVYHARKD